MQRVSLVSMTNELSFQTFALRRQAIAAFGLALAMLFAVASDARESLKWEPVGHRHKRDPLHMFLKRDAGLGK